MFCRKCGIENEKGVAYCKNCGASLGDVQAEIVTTGKEEKNEPVKKEIVNNNGSKSNKKLILIIGGIVGAIILVIAVIALFLVNSGSSDKKIAAFDPDPLIIIKKDGKYGYINSKGKVVLEPQYLSATLFKGDYAVVSIKNPKKENDYHDNVYQVIDKKGRVKAEAYYDSYIKYYDEHDIWIINEELYNGKLKKVTKDGLKVTYEDGYLRWFSKDKKTAGIMNLNGKVTYKYTFKDGESYFGYERSNNTDNFKQRYCRTNIDNEKYGIVNCDTGKVIYDYSTKYISDESYNIFSINEKSGYKFIEKMYIQNDEIIYKTENNNVRLTGYNYKDGYIEIYDSSVKDYNDRYSYVDLSNGKIVKDKTKIKKDPKMQDVKLDDFESTTKYTKFSCDKGYGIMSGEKVVIPCEWKRIEYFDLSLYKYLESKGKKYILAVKDDKTYLLNLKNGKQVAEFNSTSVQKHTGSIFLTYTEKNKAYIYNIVTGKSQKFDKKDNVGISSSYVVVKDGNKYIYYNSDFKKIYTGEK